MSISTKKKKRTKKGEDKKITRWQSRGKLKRLHQFRESQAQKKKKEK
jgi:hypothetical protein